MIHVDYVAVLKDLVLALFQVSDLGMRL